VDDRSIEDKPMRVVMFGPGPQSPGGMYRFATIVDEARRPELSVRIVSTYADNAHRRLPVFLSSLWAACRLNPAGDLVAHVNVAAGGSTVRKYLLVCVLKWRKVPVVLHLHASSYREFLDSLGPRMIARVSKFFSMARMVVVLGSDSAEMVTTQLGVDSSKVAVVPNGVPGPESVPVRSASGGLSLLFAGELSERKGVPDLIKALARIEPGVDWAMVIAGGGDIPALKAEIGGLGMADRIDLPGWIEQQALHGYRSSADVFVLPSYREGLPLAVLEAMAYGMAVITTPVGNIGDLIDDGVNGLLVQPGDQAGLAAAIGRLARDRLLLAALGKAARETWVESYSENAMIDALEDVWRTTLGQ